MNTSAYHPQSDGLIERFNRTLTDMLAKSVSTGTTDWDEKLPYVLFSYRASLQFSTGESPFFLLYGRDPQLPTETILSPPVDRQIVELDDYKSVMVHEMGSAWKQALQAVGKAQRQQKQQYDKSANDFKFSIGDRVFVCMPALKTGHRRKLACPFEGPYRVVSVYPKGVEVRLVEKLRSQPIRVALNRVRHCPEQVREQKESGDTGECTDAEGQGTDPIDSDPSMAPGTWSGRLRPRCVCSRTTEAQSGEM